MTVDRFPPAVHRADPPTAYEAEARHERSGKRASHAAQVLRAVQSNPGLTAAHYGDITGLGHIETQRRLSDMGEVVKGSRGLYGQRPMVTWWPAQAQARLAL